jgi:Domain of unknown function (DUF5666)
MEDRLIDILDQSLERLTQGATIEECLAAFPGERAELELPLQVAGQLRALPRPQMPAATRVALEQTMLDLAARRRINQAPNQATPTGPAPQAPWHMLEPAAVLAGFLRMLGYRGALRQPWLRLAALAFTVVLALLLSAGTFAAARALISLARPQPPAVPTTASTATATTTPTATPIAIDGQIEQLAQERWVIGGRAVILTASTTISGTPALNAIAHVRGSFAEGGALLALQIAVDPIAPTLSATPSATPAPTATLAPSATPEPTAIPTTVPTAPPASAPQPAAPPALQPTAPPAPPADDQQHICQGQQRGRDDKTCDPKPKPNQKPDKDKKDKKHN